MAEPLSRPRGHVVPSSTMGHVPQASGLRFWEPSSWAWALCPSSRLPSPEALARNLRALGPRRAFQSWGIAPLSLSPLSAPARLLDLGIRVYVLHAGLAEKASDSVWMISQSGSDVASNRDELSSNLAAIFDSCRHRRWHLWSRDDCRCHTRKHSVRRIHLACELEAVSLENEMGICRKLYESFLAKHAGPAGRAEQRAAT